jgi:superkiller protein 3
LNSAKRALDYPLPLAGIEFVARHYAANSPSGSAAVRAYQTYIQAHQDMPLDPRDPVYLAAEKTCTLSQSDGKARLQQVERLAQAYYRSDQRLGWAAFRHGQSLFWQGNQRKALPSLERAAQLQPQIVETHMILGKTRFGLKHTNKALDAFRHATRLAPNDVEPKFWLGHVLVNNRRLERLAGVERKRAVAEACRCLESVIVAQPRRATAHYDLGLAHFAGRVHSQARTDFERALALQASVAEWHFDYARVLDALEESDAAISAAQRAIRHDPKHRLALSFLGDQLSRVQHWTEAESTYRQLLALEPKSADAHVGLGCALFEQGQHREAVEHLQVPKPATRKSLYFMGRALSGLGEFESSIQVYQGAVAQFGVDADLSYALGCALAHLGQYKAALAAFDQSLAEKESGITHVQIGHVHAARGDRKAALAAYRTAVRMAPELPEAYDAMGRYFYAAGDLDAAEQEFSAAAQADPNYARAFLGLGVVSETRGQLTRAKKQFRKALAASGPPALLYVRLGVIASKQERYRAAADDLARAKQAGNDSDELHYHLGLAHARLENWAQAADAWALLAQRHPRDEELLLNIARCRYQLGYRHFQAGDFGAAAQEWESCALVLREDKQLRQALSEAHLRHCKDQLRPAAHGGTVPAGVHHALTRAGEIGVADTRRITYLEALGALAAGHHASCVEKLYDLCQAEDSDGRMTYHLGFALWQSGHPKEAAPYLERALETDLPTSLQLGARLMLADHYALDQNWEKAAFMYRAAFETQAGPSPATALAAD